MSLCVDGVPKPNRPIPVFKVKIKKVATINLDELHRFLESKAAMSNNCLTAIMSLDILIRHKPAMLYTTVGRSFFTPDGSQPLAGCLEVWRGLYREPWFAVFVGLLLFVSSLSVIQHSFIFLPFNLKNIESARPSPGKYSKQKDNPDL